MTPLGQSELSIWLEVSEPYNLRLFFARLVHENSCTYSYILYLNLQPILHKLYARFTTIGCLVAFLYFISILFELVIPQSRPLFSHGF